jgi:hypothetical protein
MARLARWSFVLSILLAWASASTAGAAVTREEVEKAIREGVAYLRKNQLPDGTWPGVGGTTELATLALLTSGVPAADPGIARALAYIRERHNPDQIDAGHKTYALSLQTMVFAAADPEGDRDLIARNAEWLIQNQLITSHRVVVRERVPSGSWTYHEGRAGMGDNSNTQYALLGLNAASEAGVPIPPRVWLAARDHWEWCQMRDGGWGYHARSGSSASMTTAGISSLIITGQRVFQGHEALVDGKIRHCGQGEMDIPLRRGIDWLGANFSVKQNVGGGGNKLYYLYGLERAGRLSGLRYFNGHDWYREGAEEMVRTQNHLSGGWQDAYGPVISTSFALLFLAKGRAPVLVNKLRHAPGGDWNNDNDDVRNLVEVVSADWKNLLTWQAIDPNVATVEDMLQAPIVFFNGHEPPAFGAVGKENLRAYVEQGGFIVAEACCSRPEFDRGFRALIKEIFPEPGYDLHPLSEEHPIWRAKHLLDPGIHPLWGIEHGCRTVVIYSPEDLSCFWNQAKNSPTDTTVLKAIKVGQNIVDYATGRELPADKLVVREIKDFKTEAPRRGALRIAKLKHSGEWNIAPMAIPNLMNTLRKPPLNLDVVISQKDLAPNDPNIVNYPLIYLHGRAAFSLVENLDTLRRHLDPGGGTIFADAACGSPAFDASFRKFAAALLPNNPLVPIPPDDEIYTKQVGFDLSDVQFSKAAGGGRGFPPLEGVKLDGHWAVIYSKLDLGCALEHHQGLDCKGYTHESALRIAANVVLYSTLP